MAKQTLGPAQQPLAAQGAKLFSLNCAHCHGIDATGDEGPDLHGLTKTDTRLKSIILNGIKGEMPAFNKKFKDEDAQALIAFLRTLKG
jgi:mono/diheme cytochrome c family protein